MAVVTNIIQIRYSKDGGRNWSAWRERDLGEVGDFMKRVKCLRLGQGRQWVFDIKTTSPVRCDLLAASIQI